MAIDPCLTETIGRRKAFWTTTPDCGDAAVLCGKRCAVPAMKYVDANGNNIENDTFNTQPTTIYTGNWITSLVLNIFFTNGRLPLEECGHRPGTRGGHWADSFRTDNQTAGSLIRQIPVGIPVRQATLLVKNYAQEALQKLIINGVATAVTVDAQYQGNGLIGIDIKVTGSSGENARVGVNASRLANGWVWRTQQ